MHRPHRREQLPVEKEIPQSRRGMLELSVQYDEHACLGGLIGIPERDTSLAVKGPRVYRDARGIADGWQAYRACFNSVL